MKLETFLEKFDQLAGAPDGVAKMRELVLHLAVHGNLFSQSPDDEPASKLLKRSRAEMSKRMAARQAKQEKPAESVSDDEATFSLPDGWAWCRLVDAGQFINGLAFKATDWGSVGRPIIRIQNLSGRNPDYNRTIETFDSSVLVQDGDILVSWSATLDAFIWRGEEGVLNQHIFRVLTAPLADKGYLYWLLKWVIRQLAESDHAHGLVMSHINRGPFLAHPIPLPPLAEQQRIVAKVDELMVLCDRLAMQQQERETQHAGLARASLARFADAPTPANLPFLFHQSYTIPPADLRKSILTLAVQGKLVPQDSNDEPAEDLFAHLQKLTSGAKQRTNGVSAIELPFEIPACWKRTHLDAVTRVFSGSAFQSGDFQKEAGIRAIKITNVGVRYFNETDEFLPSGFERKFPNFLVREGDILMALTRPYILDGLKVARCPELYDGALLNQRVGAIQTAKGKDISDFLYLYLCSDFVLEYVIEKSRTLNQPNLNIPDLRCLPFPLPPLAEQRRIVAKVDQLMSLVDALETQLAASRTIAQNLLAALVADLTVKG